MLNKEYLQSFYITKEMPTREIQKVFDFLECFCQEKQIEFELGREKRKNVHQKFQKEGIVIPKLTPTRPLCK